VHPFTTSFGLNDVRITTKIVPDFLSPCLFGTFHECGHALYEQGIAKKYNRTPWRMGLLWRSMNLNHACGKT
jgi:carboxypeptidase Taq